MRPITRTITCHYEDATGKHEIAVSLYRAHIGTARDWVIETDLSDVPADERESVEQQAIEGWVAADGDGDGGRRAPRSGRSLTTAERRANGLGLLQGLWLPAALLARVDAACARRGLPRTAVVREALESWLSAENAT